MTQPVPSTAVSDDGVLPDIDFERFYVRWHPSLLRWAAKRYGETHADEIAQETLSRAFIHFRELRRDVPWPWLLTVARNVACDLKRTSTRFTCRAPQGMPDRADPAPGPEELAERLDIDMRLRAAMKDMSDCDRSLLTMAVHDELTMAQIADALGTSEGAVRVRLHRARKRLGHLYGARGGQLAASPLAVFVWFLRRVRRSVQQAIPTAAPAGALMTAAATMATIGAVLGGAHAFSSPAARAHHSVADRILVHTAPAASSKQLSPPAGRTTKLTAPVRTKPAGVPVAQPVVAAHYGAGVSKDPSRPGRVAHHHLTLHAATVEIHVSGRLIRSHGNGIKCLPLTSCGSGG